MSMLVLFAAVLGASPAAAQSPSISTDKLDYLPGEIVTITGTGWMPGETVSLLLVEDPHVCADTTFYSVADVNGNFTNTDFSPDIHDLGVHFTLTATGQTSGWVATTTFTDGGGIVVEFAAAEPTTYDHSTGGGIYNDGSNPFVVESLEGGDFECGDIVTFLTRVTNSSAGDDATLRLDFNFACNTTGGDGVGYESISAVFENPGDPGTSTDGGETVTLISATQNGDLYMGNCEIVTVVEITDLDEGESIIVRIDAVLGCTTDPNANPTGNVQANFDGGCKLIAVDNCDPLTFQGGAQTISLKNPGALLTDADLELTKTVDATSVAPGDTVTFTVTLTNNGPLDATGVTVADQLGSGFSCGATVSIPAGDTFDCLTGIWDVGDLAVNETVVLQYEAVVGTTGFFNNYVQVETSDQPDPDSDPGDDSQDEDDDDIVTIIQKPTFPPNCGALDVTIQCDEPTDPSNTGTPTVIGGTCPGGVNPPTFTDSVVQDPDCANASVITRTWTVTDNCGESDTCVQVITVIDDVNPVPPTAPADASFTCLTDVPAAGELTATDNCSADITVTGVDSDNGGTGCVGDPLIITRTWTFTDDCGNSASVVQTLTVIDDVNPVPPAAPADASFTCLTDVPAAGELTATDNCSADITVTGVDSDNGGTGCVGDPLIITRTWTFTDDCGNSASVVQTLTVIDDVNPVPPAAPADASFTCLTDVPAAGELTATDNCSADITVTGVDSDNGGTGCVGDPLIITRTWTFTDDCGNSASVVQTLTVIDDVNPVPPAAPADASFTCLTDVPAAGELTATDNCSADITVTGVDSDNGGTGCVGDPLIITRTWTFTDDCGNSASVVQTLTVIDDVNPVPPAAPADASFTCLTDVPAAGELTATDNCSADITVTGVDSDNGGTGCVGDPLIITRTWTFTDDCGNSASVVQTLTVIDDVNPVPPAAPADASFTCLTDVPAAGELTATDNCSADITVTGVDSDNGGTGCVGDPLIITRTWTFTDDCGNSASVVQTLTVIDDVNPVPPTAPADASFTCLTDVPAAGELTATDNCSADITVTGVDSDNGGTGCVGDPLIITRTWTFTDDCGNSASVVQTLTVIDDVNPVPPAAPADASFTCLTDVPAAGELTATDNCSADITVTGVDSDNGGTGCVGDPLIITRTWTFTDDCGNSASVVQTLTVIDDVNPVPPAAPADASFTCLTDVPAAGELTATDNCSADITVTGVDSDNGGTGCVGDPLIITRTWTFTDDCGNSASVVQTLTVIDDVNPVPPAAPADASFTCLTDVPAAGELTATDNCSADITVTGVDSDNGGTGCVGDPLIITRTWTFTDDCGNSASVVQTLTVIDDVNPVPPTAPADASFTCLTDVPAAGELTATDNCSADITVTGVDSDNGGTGCVGDPLIITRTWTFTDDCGNSASVVQTLTVIDDVNPVPPAAPADASFTCLTDVPAAGELTATDNCSADITVTGVDSDNGGTGCVGDPLIITRTWTFTDDCGNSASVVQTLTVIDDVNPVPPAAPADASFTCLTDVPAAGELTATDNCSADITVTGVDSDNGGTGCVGDPLIITRTWTFTDDCGNSASVVQTLTVIDDVNPVPPAAPADASFTCLTDVPAAGELTATDNCSADITVTGVDSDNGGTGCVGDPLIITRTWTFTDDCGNSASVVQTLTVIDDVNPVPPAAPADASFTCLTDVPAAGELTATDNCSADITVTGVDSDNGGTGCVGDPLIITRTWTFTDDCGNSASVVQTLTVIDDVNPVPPAAPADASFTCLTDVPAAGELTATDNCSADITVTGVDSDNGGTGCVGDPLIITRTWTFTDDCGNSASVVQTLTVIDDVNPVPPAAPADASFTCLTDVPAAGELTATDNCSADITVTGVDSDNGGTGCVGDPLIITRTWTFTDDCGNSASVVQTLTVIDDVNPVLISCSADTVMCVDGPVTVDYVPATATDNCDDDVTVVCDPAPGTLFQIGTTTVTCTATDNCGNTATCSFTVTLNQNPVCGIEGSDAITAGMIADYTAADPGVPNPTYQWSVDEGCTIVGSANAPSVQIQAELAGTCTLTLTVTSPEQCVTVCTKTITVQEGFACPRTIGFWNQQCKQKGKGSQKMCASALQSIWRDVINTTGVSEWVTNDGGTELTSDLQGLNDSRLFRAMCDQLEGPNPMDINNMAEMQYLALKLNVLGGALSPATWVDLTDLGINFQGTVADAILFIEDQLNNGGDIVLAKDIADAINNRYGIEENCPENENAVFNTVLSEFGCEPLPIIAAEVLPVGGKQGGDSVAKAGQTEADIPTVFGTKFYPNPSFSQSNTTIFFTVTSEMGSSDVELAVYDVSGRLVRRLSAGDRAPGYHNLTWDLRSTTGNRVSAGIYFLRLRVGEKRVTAKHVVLRK